MRAPPDAPPPSAWDRGREQKSAGWLDNPKGNRLVVERAMTARARCESVAGLLARAVLGMVALDKNMVLSLVALVDAANRDLDRVLVELGAEVAS